jgi:hypothetical protein
VRRKWCFFVHPVAAIEQHPRVGGAQRRAEEAQCFELAAHGHGDFRLLGNSARHAKLRGREANKIGNDEAW